MARLQCGETRDWLSGSSYGPNITPARCGPAVLPPGRIVRMYWDQFWHMLRRGIIIFPHPNPGPAKYIGISIWWLALPVLMVAIGVAVFVMSSKRRDEIPR